jgi:hypothetical protein
MHRPARESEREREIAGGECIASPQRICWSFFFTPHPKLHSVVSRTHTTKNNNKMTMTMTMTKTTTPLQQGVVAVRLARRAAKVLAGETSAETGGSLTLHAGYDSKSTSGSMSLQTLGAGTAGVSGALVMSSGAIPVRGPSVASTRRTPPPLCLPPILSTRRYCLSAFHLAPSPHSVLSDPSNLLAPADPPPKSPPITKTSQDETRETAWTLPPSFYFPGIFDDDDDDNTMTRAEMSDPFYGLAKFRLIEVTYLPPHFTLTLTRPWPTLTMTLTLNLTLSPSGRRLLY